MKYSRGRKSFAPILAAALLFTLSIIFCSTAKCQQSVGKSGELTELLQAMTLLKTRNFKAALPLLNVAYQKNQMPPECSYNMGICYAGLGDMEKARQYFSFVSKTWPNTEASKHADLQLKQLDAMAPHFEGPTSARPAYAKFHLNEYGHMIVHAQMNGVPVRMLFDTGAEACVATKSQLDDFGVKVNATTKARVIGVGGETETRIALVNLTVGGITRPIHMYVQDDSVLRGNQGAHAVLDIPLLGQEFFNDLVVDIDAPHERIGFSIPDGKRPEGAIGSVPFSRRGMNIIVRPKIMGRECDMILDTGASSLAFSDRQYSGLGFSRPTSADSSQSLGVGGMRAGYRFFIDKVEFGPIQKSGVLASLSLNSNLPDPLFGASFLGGAHFMIEPKSKQIYFFK